MNACSVRLFVGVDVLQNFVFYAVRINPAVCEFAIIRYLAKRESNVNRKWFPPVNKQGSGKISVNAIQQSSIQPRSQGSLLPARDPWERG